MWLEWGKFEKTSYPGQELHRSCGIQFEQSSASAESSAVKVKKEKRELPNRLSFSGRVAIVTGGGRGTGRAHCLMLAERGAKVLVNDKAKDKADEVVAAIKAKGGEAAADYNDIASAGEAVVDSAVRHFGGVDILVLNQGQFEDCKFDSASVAQHKAFLQTH